MKDKNGNPLKIGDTIVNKGGMIGKLENIGGLCRVIVYDTNGNKVQALRCDELNLENFEKVIA